jgi:hypothetical protein
VRKALNPGGRVVTVEFTMNEDSPKPAAVIFGMTMLVCTPNGRTYTFRELEGIFQKVGFPRSEMHKLTGTAESAIVSYTD